MDSFNFTLASFALCFFLSYDAPSTNADFATSMADATGEACDKIGGMEGKAGCFFAIAAGCLRTGFGCLSWGGCGMDGTLWFPPKPNCDRFFVASRREGGSVLGVLTPGREGLYAYGGRTTLVLGIPLGAFKPVVAVAVFSAACR